jgi:hypothetical protein
MGPCTWLLWPQYGVGHGLLRAPWICLAGTGSRATAWWTRRCKRKPREREVRLATLRLALAHSFVRETEEAA